MGNGVLSHIDTVCSRDIENKVFQSIALQCLAQVEGIGLLEGNLIDSLLGREIGEGVKGIHVVQDEKQHSVSLKIEINIAYGVCIPNKAEEIHTKLAEELSRLTGLRVASIHLVFKSLMAHKAVEKTDSKSEFERELCGDL